MNHNAKKLPRIGLWIAAALAVSFAACTIGGAVASDKSAATADSVATDVTWSSRAIEYRDSINLRIAYDCPDSGAAFIVWGSDVYTDDSSVCTAGVHAGKITFATGGRVIIEMRPGQDSYDSLTRNGVTTNVWPSWPGSFVFL